MINYYFINENIIIFYQKYQKMLNLMQGKMIFWGENKFFGWKKSKGKTPTIGVNLLVKKKTCKQMADRGLQQ